MKWFVPVLLALVLFGSGVEKKGSFDTEKRGSFDGEKKGQFDLTKKGSFDLTIAPGGGSGGGTGDVVIIPAGVYHGFSEVADHIEYVSVRPDLDKVLPAGYVNPALAK